LEDEEYIPGEVLMYVEDNQQSALFFKACVYNIKQSAICDQLVRKLYSRGIVCLMSVDGPTIRFNQIDIIWVTYSLRKVDHLQHNQ
jgi:hypothetical protein